MQGRRLTGAEREATRRRVVEVATALLEEEGREACTLRRVAAEAGVSRSTPYTYFPDKEALIDAVRAAALHALSDRCEAAAFEVLLADTREVLAFGFVPRLGAP